MATTTSPDGLVIPTGTDQIAPLQTTLAAMQNSVQSAIVQRNQSYSPLVANASARDAIFPAPVQGNRVYRSDLAREEVYLSAYSAGTNPNGTTGTAGWYPSTMGSVEATAIRNSTAGIASDTSRVAITLTDITFSRGANFSISNGGLVVPFTGEYMLRSRITFPYNATGNRVSTFMVNGAVTPAGNVDSRPPTQSAGTTFDENVTIFETLRLSAGDYVQAAVIQNSGSTLTLAAPAATVSVWWVRH
jgi:hypothetical protein